MDKKEHYEKYALPLASELSSFANYEVKGLDDNDIYYHLNLAIHNFRITSQSDIKNTYPYAWRLYYEDEFLAEFNYEDIPRIVRFIYYKPKIALKVFKLWKDFKDEVNRLFDFQNELIENIIEEQSLEATNIELKNKIDKLFTIIELTKEIRE